MTKPADYVWIARWGNRLGSYIPYVESQQEKAAQEDAPLTAIFESSGVWMTVEDITNEDTLRSLAKRYANDPEAVELLAARVAALHAEEDR
jgi:hypothetical protein